MFLIAIPWIAGALIAMTTKTVSTTAGTVVCATAAKGIDSCKEK